MFKKESRQLSSQPAVSRLHWHAGYAWYDSYAAPLPASEGWGRRTAHARQIPEAPQISGMFRAQDQPLQTHAARKGGKNYSQSKSIASLWAAALREHTVNLKITEAQ